MALRQLKPCGIMRIFSYNSHPCRISCNSRTFMDNSGPSESNVRVRFAPSPTGHLHLGGLRTALYNYLFAKANEGAFILRIEDTDQTRLVPGATEKLIKMLQWAGIQIDEGPLIGGLLGPYVQSERIETYWENIQPLLQNGTAYHCFCTPKRLELLRKDALRRGETPKYDNRCRHLSSSEVEKNLTNCVPYVIRLKLEPFVDPWEDLVYGNIAYDVSSVEGDPVLLKTDRFPTYHFANVVDDHLMQITHVLRGQEWQVSTTKHLLLYKALGWHPPQFGHLPLILNKDGSKLSKRQNDIHVEHFQKGGFFPDAVLNLLTTMGSGFKVRHTAGLSLPELVDNFELTNMNSNSTRLELERVTEFNRLHLKRALGGSERSHVINQCRLIIQNHLKNRSIDINQGNLQQQVLHDSYIGGVLDWAQDRIHVLQDLIKPDMEFLWIVPSKEAVEQLSTSKAEVVYTLQTVRDTLNKVPDEQFTRTDVTTVLKAMAEEHRWKYSSCMKWLRTAISGLQVGPSVAEMVTVLGKVNTLERLEYMLSKVSTQKSASPS